MLLRSSILTIITFFVISYSSNLFAEGKNQGCAYFNNKIKIQKDDFESEPATDDKHRYAYGYAFEKINQCLNPELYTSGDEKSIRDEPTSQGTFSNFFSEFFDKGTPDDAPPLSQASTPKHCYWMTTPSDPSEKQPEQPHVITQAIKCAASRDDFSWPNDIDWLIAPLLLETLKKTKETNNSPEKVCHLKGALYQYRFWRAPYLQDNNGNNYKGIGFKIRDALMQQEDFPCIKDGKIINSVVGEVTDKTNDFDEHERIYVITDPITKKYKHISRLDISYEVKTVKSGIGDNEPEYQVRPKINSPYMSVTLNKDKSGKTNSFHYELDYKKNDGLFILEFCKEFTHIGRPIKEGEVISISSREDVKCINSAYENYLLKHNKDKTIRIETNEEKNDKTKATTKIFIDDYLAQGNFNSFIGKNKGKSCVASNHSDDEYRPDPGIPLGDHRIFYYHPENNIGNMEMKDYMHFHDETKETIQRNIFNCLTKFKAQRNEG